MKWAHLPIAGGVFDQPPALLDKFEYIFQRIAEKEAEERRKAERKQDREMRSARRRR